MQLGGRNILVIDLGGTNIRAGYGSAREAELDKIQKIKLDKLEHFYETLDYLLESSVDKIEHVVISVAGPRDGSLVTMTNRDWIISSDELQRKFKLKSCSLLNDWEAIAYCLPSLKNEDLHVIREGKVLASDHGPKLIIGPGTGLGAALYSQNNSSEYVHPTEIGNTRTSLQYYLNIFGINDSDSFTILEDVLSGPGLTKIYKHLEGEEISTEEILSRLNKNNDSICAEIIDNYIKCFAVLCSEMALTYNCTGGIFLAGGLMREIESYFDNDIFNQHFISVRKQVHKNFLENIPVFLVKKQFTPLYGNLNYFLKRS